LFEPYAKDLARRVQAGRGASVLEVAAGTGILTRHLLDALPRDAHLVATDVNDAMMAVGKHKIAPDARLEWRHADAGALPFGDHVFDAVACQFGLMFFPDKARALREMLRVLKPDGHLWLSTWGSLADNPIAAIAHRTVAEFYHIDPPQFFTIPWGMDDPALVEGLLQEAGFTQIETDVVDRIGESESAAAAAKGLVFGNPIINAIQERGTVSPEPIMHAVATRLSQEGGAQPMRLPMRALIFHARA
jgi:SAM-dependent methyltransferase